MVRRPWTRLCIDARSTPNRDSAEVADASATPRPRQDVRRAAVAHRPRRRTSHPTGACFDGADGAERTPSGASPARCEVVGPSALSTRRALRPIPPVTREHRYADTPPRKRRGPISCRFPRAFSRGRRSSRPAWAALWRGRRGRHSSCMTGVKLLGRLNMSHLSNAQVSPVSRPVPSSAGPTNPGLTIARTAKAPATGAPASVPVADTPSVRPETRAGHPATGAPGPDARQGTSARMNGGGTLGGIVGVENETETPEVVAQTIYRQLRQAGYSEQQVIALAGELLSLVTADVRNQNPG